MSVTSIDAVPGPRDDGPRIVRDVDDGWRRAPSADGTRIAWRRDGPRWSSTVPVVLCNGIACSTAYWSDVAALLAVHRPVVRWDYRGHGRSATPSDPAAVTIDDTIHDLEAVLAAADVGRAVVMGHSFGVQVALEAVRHHADKVAGVVAVAGTAGTPLLRGAARAHLGALDLAQRAHGRLPEQTEDVWRAWWRSPVTHLVARAVGGTSAAAPRDIMTSYYEHVSTRDISVLLAMLRTMADHDASEVLRGLQVPLLVLAGSADRLTPLPVMSRLALSAPDGELAVCHGGTHTLPAERPRWVVEQVAPLLARADARASGPNVIETRGGAR